MKQCVAKKGKGKVIVVFDGQAGSCGKGKLIGYLAQKNNIGVAINNFMSNAGHTYVDNDGNKFMTQHLPSSMMNRDTMLLIGPGAAITPYILFDEINKYRDIIGERKIYIHPRAMVILDRHAEKEKELVRSGSTFKGCGVAQAEKAMRVPGTMLFGDYMNQLKKELSFDADFDLKYVYNKIEVADTALILNTMLDMGIDVMVEGSQGFDLDINYGLPYPHTTSRQCHAGQLVADCGISPLLVTDVIMIIRPYPIRISNQTNIGIEISSGDYEGSREITWDIIRDRCGAPSDIEFGEITTVTKKPRRVFEMNWDRLKYAATINRPTAIFLNFAQYIDWDVNGIVESESNGCTPKLCEFISKVETITRVPVMGYGTGAKNNEVVMFMEV